MEASGGYNHSGGESEGKGQDSLLEEGTTHEVTEAGRKKRREENQQVRQGSHNHWTPGMSPIKTVPQKTKQQKPKIYITLS